MDPMPTVKTHSKIQEAAELIVKNQSNIIAVLSDDDMIAGVFSIFLYYSFTIAKAIEIHEDRCHDQYSEKSFPHTVFASMTSIMRRPTKGHQMRS